MNTLPAGWARPPASRKYHYFPQDDIMALCHRWMFAGDYREDEYDEHPENCATCKRLIRARRQQAERA